MSRGTIAGAFLVLVLLVASVAGYVLYTRSEAYEIGIARGPGEVEKEKSPSTPC